MTKHDPCFTRLHVSEEGQGAPVVLLHGSVSGAKQWRSLTDYLKGRFRVISPDLPGYGKSDPLSTIPGRRLTDIATSVLAMMDFESGPVHMVGHSYGAVVALKIAAMRSEKVQSLTLIEPAAFNAFWSAHGHSAPEARQFARMGEEVQTLITQGVPEKAMQRFIDFWNGTGTWNRTSPKLQARLLTCLSQLVEDINSLETDLMSNQDLAGIVCPVKILRGADSPGVMAALTRHLLEKMPFATQTVFPYAGHMLPLTDPHLTDPAIGEFLRRVDHMGQSCESSFAQAA